MNSANLIAIIYKNPYLILSLSDLILSLSMD
jgi:hypothetical protein